MPSINADLKWLLLTAFLLLLISWGFNHTLALGMNLSLSPAWPWLYWMLVFPVLEELVFRGWLQDFLHQKLGQKQHSALFSSVYLSQANIITSLVFVLAHFGVAWLAKVEFSVILVFSLISLFIPSLWFGWLKDRYQLLLPSIVFHAYFNALFLLFNLGVILQ